MGNACGPISLEKCQTPGGCWECDVESQLMHNSYGLGNREAIEKMDANTEKRERRHIIEHQHRNIKSNSLIIGNIIREQKDNWSASRASPALSSNPMVEPIIGEYDEDGDSLQLLLPPFDQDAELNLGMDEQSLLQELANFCDKGRLGMPVDVFYKGEMIPCSYKLSPCLAYMTFSFETTETGKAVRPDIIASLRRMTELVTPERDSKNRFRHIPKLYPRECLLLVVDKHQLVFLMFENKTARNNFREPMNFLFTFGCK